MEWMNIQFETALRLATMWELVLGVLPVSVDCTRYQKLRRNILWCMSLVFSVTQVCAANYAMYKSPDIRTIAEGVPEMSSVIAVVVKLVLFKLNQKSIQALIAEMEEFLQQMSDEEKEMFQSHLRNPAFVHFYVSLFTLVAVVVYLVIPAPNHPHSLPVLAEYPFPIESTQSQIVAFINQCYLVFLDGCAINMDVYFLLILWSVVARFQMLHTEILQITSVLDLHRCIAKQQQLIDYAERLLNILRWPAVLANSMNIIVMALGGFFIIRDPRIKDDAPFLLFIGVALNDLFLFTWAAEYLARSSEQIRDAVYSSEWVGGSPEMQQDMQFVMQRSANPIIMRMDVLLPTLNLEFFGTTLSAIFSYIATLRALTLE